eukprot:CAMPEP_0115159796 /NCGR_PEP_ID=MMETSP0227-20121206/70441_1 /TAXON_ID=89957 /ORGANISM="Polarella glacialis, Strain CCMP 1383" /LENGTH=96 /DNA_ID=CAMNT_0002571607 /DNA_START=69 /DNA_END=359 /DNA_ORIENTATION=+
MAEAAKDDGGRGGLPGIRPGLDRVSAECIWKGFCNEENEYLRGRAKNPPKGKESLITMHGFEVVKHTSYLSVRRKPRSSGSSSSLEPVGPTGPMSK